MSLHQKLPTLAADRRAALSTASTAAAAVFSAAGSGDVDSALSVAESIADLRVHFDDPAIKARIVALQDTPIGFRTDRDPKQINKKTERPNIPYDYETVKDCAIEAMLRGLQIVGNQFNIISSRCYMTKEGLEFLIRRRTDVTLFQITLGIPRLLNGGAIVLGEASWQQNGTPRTVKAELPVKADGYSGADQILGKATRKLLARCYSTMTGTSVPEGDAEDSDAAPALPPPGAAADASAASTTDMLKSTAPATPRQRVAPKPATAAPVPSEPAAKAPAPTAPPLPEKPAQTELPVTAALAPGPAPSAESGPGPLPEEIVEELLTSANVNLDDFFSWLVSSGRVQDASLMEHVSDVPQPVLNELVADKCKGIRKCLTLHGHA